MSKWHPPRPRALTRRKAQRAAKLAVVIVCEGKNTEPHYFKSFAAEHGNMLVDLKIIDSAGVPMSLVNEAMRVRADLSKRAKNSNNSFEERDQVWAVFDCDDHPEIVRAIEQAVAAGVQIGYSNPCFELWALLHFQDHDAPIGRREL